MWMNIIALQDIRKRIDSFHKFRFFQIPFALQPALSTSVAFRSEARFKVWVGKHTFLRGKNFVFVILYIEKKSFYQAQNLGGTAPDFPCGYVSANIPLFPFTIAICYR